MKNLLLISLFFLSSCTSYKPLNQENLVNGMQYEITDRDGVTSKITVLEIKPDSLRIQRNGLVSTISRDNITTVREKKFSWMKTAGLVIVYATAGTGIILLSILKMSGW